MTSTSPIPIATILTGRVSMILCDTGPLVAAFNAADRDHVRCTAFLRENWSRLVIPSLAVTEVCHLLADRQRRGRPELAAELSWRRDTCRRVID
jgi:predicted nucleic acid-binding protein